MAVAFVIDGGLNDPPGTGTELHAALPEVRAAYEQAADWTGVPVRRMLSWELDRSAEYQQVGAIRQAALVFGVCDALAGLGVRPGVAAGMSRGAMVGAVLAGAVARRDLYGLLTRLREVPEPAGPAQGVAQLFVPPGVDPAEFVGGFPEDVYIAGDIGPVAGGAAYLVLLSGYQDALRKLAGQMADKTALRIPPDVTTAFHSPLRQHVRDFQEPYLAAMTFRDPGIPLCGGLDSGTYTSAEQVRGLFRRNHTEAINLPVLLGALRAADTEVVLLIGPGLVQIWRGVAGCPVVHVEGPGDLAEALDVVREVGVGVGSGSG
ncbi:MAG: hypothetical protein ACJ786_15995 [Catenulispora sp.]